LIASFLATGSISWLYYSDRLVEFPLGVFGIALATVILPSLSDHHARASKDSFSATLDWALRCVLLVSLPAAVGLIVLAKPTLITIFHGGVFTETDVDMAAASLCAFAPGLVGFILVKVLSPGYFARQDTRTPVRIGIRSLVVAMVFNVIFVVTLVYTGWAPPHAGLAAATTLSALLNSTWLLRGLVHANVYRPSMGWRQLFIGVTGACAVMTVFALWLLSMLGDWYAMSTTVQIGSLSLAVASSGIVYVAACYVFGLRLADFRHRAPV
jgi:putative peptidoglycan lipid II flippase